MAAPHLIHAVVEDGTGTVVNPGDVANKALRVAVVSGGGSATPPNTGTLSNVSASATSVQLLASNASRKGAVIFNDSTVTLYVKCNSGSASTTSFTYKIPAGGTCILENGDYTGEIQGIWSSATGAARVTEFS